MQPKIAEEKAAEVMMTIMQNHLSIYYNDLLERAMTATGYASSTIARAAKMLKEDGYVKSERIGYQTKYSLVDANAQRKANIPDVLPVRRRFINAAEAPHVCGKQLSPIERTRLAIEQCNIKGRQRMRNAEREEIIMTYINEHGSRTAEHLCAVVHAGRDAMAGALNNLVREGRLIVLPITAGARQIHPAYGLPSVKPKYDPMDPFGLVAKRAAELRMREFINKVEVA